MSNYRLITQGLTFHQTHYTSAQQCQITQNIRTVSSESNCYKMHVQYHRRLVKHNTQSNLGPKTYLSAGHSKRLVSK